MDWVGASVLTPRPNVAIEFEVASMAGVHKGYFHDSRFFSAGDATGYPRKLVRRWRYLSEETAPGDATRATA